MANGDAAAAKGMQVVSGDADRRMGYDEINLTRDYIAGEMDARTAGDAGKAPAVHQHKGEDITSGIVANARTTGTASDTANTLVLRNAGGTFAVGAPTAGTHPATKNYCDSNTSAEANGPTDAAYSRNATGSGWYQVWMNSSNQFMRNTSSRRYKEHVRELQLADVLRELLQLRPVTYHRRGQPDGTREVGLIAEECVDVPGLVTWDVPRDAKGKPLPNRDPRPEAVRYETVLPVYLLALVQWQAEQLGELTARVAALEAGGGL